LACNVCGISQSSYYYKSVKSSQDDAIKQRLLALAEEYPRRGFDKMMSILKLENCGWNHKRVYRIYCELGLNIRVKPKKRLPSGEAKALLQPITSNVCWSMDFMTDVLRNGRRFRTLNVIDDYNREGLLITVSHSLTSLNVINHLRDLITEKGYPEKIRVDNGSEFTSHDFKKWAKSCGITIDYIQPGKPAQNGFVERFNRTYREEVLDMYLFDNMKEVQQLTDEWLQDYNHNRPHESLDNKPPVVFARDRMRINEHEK